MEAVELGLREALFKDGRALLESLYNQDDLQVPDNASRPGEKCHPQRAKDCHSLFGPLRLRRNYFYDPQTRRFEYLEDVSSLDRIKTSANWGYNVLATRSPFWKQRIRAIDPDKIPDSNGL